MIKQLLRDLFLTNGPQKTEPQKINPKTDVRDRFIAPCLRTIHKLIHKRQFWEYLIPSLKLQCPNPYILAYYLGQTNLSPFFAKQFKNSPIITRCLRQFVLIIYDG